MKEELCDAFTDTLKACKHDTHPYATLYIHTPDIGNAPRQVSSDVTVQIYPVQDSVGKSKHACRYRAEAARNCPCGHLQSKYPAQLLTVLKAIG